MLFQSLAELRAQSRCGVSACMELQYCRLPARTPLEELVSVDRIAHGKPDSLFVRPDDMNLFSEAYGHVFTGGAYNNLRCGPLDPWGINYYTPAQVGTMLEKLSGASMPECERLRGWLKGAEAWNGIYCLGV